jgi:hypothetical protein
MEFRIGISGDGMRQSRTQWLRGSAILSLGLLTGACGNSDPGDLFGPPASTDGGADGASPSTSMGASDGSVPSASATDGGAVDGDGEVPPIGSGDGSVPPVSSSSIPPVGSGDGSVPPVGSSDGAVPPVGSMSADAGPMNSCSLVVTSLTAGQVLGLADDEDNDCSNGVTLDVQVSTDLADGSEADLSVGSGPAVRAVSTGGTFIFNGVVFPSTGPATAVVSVPGMPTCTTFATVQSACHEAPSCVLSHLFESAETTLLNGVAAPDGDRVSPPGQAYRTWFSVNTNAPDDSLVLLSVDDGAQTLFAYANGGVASFPSVQLGDDTDSEGTHTLVATCTAEVSTDSAPLAVEVDTSDPTLETSSITPIDGQHYSPAQDVDGSADGLQFEVCVPVDSPDALDLSGAKSDNLCVALGTQAATCAAATSGGLSSNDGGCVKLDCPGSAAFDLNVSVSDEAGNTTEHTIQGITCASEEPSVQIVSLVDATNDPGNVSKHLLAASAPNGQLKDENGSLAGAQHTLVACTNATDGSARLLAGATGSTLTERATASIVAASPGDNCPLGLTSVAIFPEATLPASTESPSLVLTEIQVEVTDVSTETNTSNPVRLWVDAVAPSLSLFSPSNFCGSVIFSTVDTSEDFIFTSSAYPRDVTVTVENGVTSTQYVLNSTTPTTVALPLGTNTVRASVSDAAGNVTVFQNDTCTVLVGDPPIITWGSPATGTTILNAAGTSPAAGTVQDSDANTAGWQGDLTVTVSNVDLQGLDQAGAIQFKVDGVDVGLPVNLADGIGNGIDTATVTLDAGDFSGISDGLEVLVTAELINASDTWSESLTVLVDTELPTQAQNVVPAIGSQPGDRRRTRFALGWDAAGDGVSGLEAVAGYSVAYATSPITDQTTFDAAFVQNGLNLGTVPANPGSPESIAVDELTIETVYYFAVQAYDAAGNLGAIAQGNAAGPDTPGLAARFKTTVLNHPGTANERFGYALDGSTDLTGDGLAELIVSSIGVLDPSSTGGKVYIYKGTPTGYSQTPIVTISGDPAVRFGYSVAVVGDIDNSAAALGPNPTAAQLAQQQDIVITAQFEANSQGTFGSAYVFFGRDWEAGPSNFVVGDGDYDAVVEAANEGGYSYSQINSVTRVGDFNNDQIDDFALGHFAFDTATPGAVSIVLGRTGFGSFVLPALTSLGEPNSLLLQGAGDGYLGFAPIFALSDGSVAASIIDSTTEVSEAVVFSPSNSSVTPLSAAARFAGQPAAGLGNYGFGLLSGDGLAVTSPDIVSPNGPGDGLVDVFLANNVINPFGGRISLYDNGTSSDFGRIIVGNAFSGRPSGYELPFFGDPGQVESTLVLGGIATSGMPPRIHFLRGSTLNGLSGTTDLATGVSDVLYRLYDVPNAPSSWVDSQGAAIRDLDGDGYADLAVGESSVGLADFDGHVIVLY